MKTPFQMTSVPACWNRSIAALIWWLKLANRAGGVKSDIPLKFGMKFGMKVNVISHFHAYA